ncbi:MAG: DUF1552 domain-containing protein [Pseudomonadota bacterium]
MRKVNLSRRNQLKAALFSTLPLSGQLMKNAMAADAAPGIKYLFIYTPDGAIPELFHPTGSETNFTTNQMTAPLEAVKNDITFLQGINMYGNGATHEGGIAKLLTGNNTSHQGKSMDILLGEKFAAETAFPSLQLGVASSFQGNASMTYLAGGAPVAYEDDPLKAFGNIFGASTGGEDGGPSPEILRRQSVIDNALKDMQSMQQQFGSVETQKLETSLDSIRQVEKRLNPDPADAPAGGACNPAGFNPTGFTLPVENGYPPPRHQPQNYEIIGDLQADLAVLSLQCGMSRVATINWSHSVSPNRIDNVGGGVANHDASHSNGSPEWIAIKAWYMQKIADLINKMKATPDTNGNTLLDNTIIMHVTELGHSNFHDHNNMAFFLAGGGAGTLTPGRLLNFNGESHAKILVALANTAGIEIDQYGDHGGQGNGALPGLLKA